MHIEQVRPAGWFLIGALGVAALGCAPTPARAQEVTRLYLGTSKASVIDLKDRASKVAIANPAIVDVQVISPTQLLLIGRGVGVTSLIVFYPRSVAQFDVVVHGAPIGAIGAEVLTGAPHVVLVQRGDKLTEQFFSRDTTDRWVEVGYVRVEAEAARK